MATTRTPEAEPLLTPAEVATMFRVDPKTVTRWAKAGKLTSIRTLGGHRRYRETEVRALLAGIPHPFAPLRMVRLLLVIVLTSMALISMMFLLMVRISDPLVPRSIFGVLNTLLFFPSGAVYPIYAFPPWMKAITVADPFTYAVHAFKTLFLKNTGFGAISFDLLYLTIFTLIMMTFATLLFRRTL